MQNAKMHSVSLMRFWAIHYYVCIKVKAVCFILMWHNSEWIRILNKTKCRAGFDFYASGTDWIPIFLWLDNVNWCYKKSHFIDRTNFKSLIEYYVDIHAMSCTIACTYESCTIRPETCIKKLNEVNFHVMQTLTL